MEWQERRRYKEKSPLLHEPRDRVPYEHGSGAQANRRGNSHDADEALQSSRHKDMNAGQLESATKKIASKIVTPSHDNVTIRGITPRSLTYSPTASPPKDAVIIGALKGMELSESFVEPVTNQFDGDVEMDDLLGEDLVAMEQGGSSEEQQEDHGVRKEAQL
ncbi:hypothetical protein Rs2_09728 [Raphanus sativus]|nr:hypothetical protein Rs2_09728 [Raphanus sativus]